MSRPWHALAAFLVSIFVWDFTGGSAAQQNASSPVRTWSWIWASGTDGLPDTVFFRQPFTLSALPASAVLRFTGRGQYIVYINGRSVLRSMGQDTLQQADLTRLLRRGRNVLAMECTRTIGAMGVAFHLTIRYGDGRILYVVSDGTVRVARTFAPGWEGVLFDDRRWAHARVIGPGPEMVTAPRRPPKSRPAEPNVPSPRFDTTRLIRVWDLYFPNPTENPYSRPRQSGERMIQSCSMPAPQDIPLVASAGFTLLQTDSPALSTTETAPGIWDFHQQDEDIRLVKSYGLDWCYFPRFAFPPPWYAKEVPFHRVMCLEHQQSVEAFSPWEPKFSVFVGRGYQKLAEKYAPKPGRAQNIDALYLGVHGDYGEAGLLVGARLSIPGQREEWERRFGNLHNHIGWWCGDPLARASFRNSMMRKYGDLDVLNAAWKTRLSSSDAITYPTGPTDGSRRRWLDFVHWYLESVGHLAESICRNARRAFPATLMMLPLGFADENPRSGADNSLLVKIAAQERVDVRSTHGGFKPFAQNQATMLGRIASACRFYGVPLWTEPPGRITPEQQVERIFTAASLGCRGYFDRAENISASRDVYYRYGRYLKVSQPVVDVAMFYPTTSQRLQPHLGYLPTFEKGCTDIRDVLNYDIVDERMVNDGALDRYRLLVMWEGPVMEANTLAKIREWVQAGGVLVAYDFGKIETVEGDRSWFADLFGYAGRLTPATVARRPLPGNRYEISIDFRRLRSDWARPYGKGWTVYFPATRRQLEGYYEVIRYLTYHLSDLDPSKNDAIAVDDAWDGIYATLFPDKILYYNPGPATLTRTIVLSPTAFAAHPLMKRPIDFTHTLMLEPNSIQAIELNTPAQEMLLQCEKFTGLGRLQPLSGDDFSPGRGQTHVLIPVGGQIITRFQCEVPGRYRVFYRALRRGRQARAEILIDGKFIEELGSSSHATLTTSAENRESIVKITRMAGTIELEKGIHTLAVRPRGGEDIRADFVILANDPTIAGYGFAVRSPQER
jgi:hypothetical protein